MNILNMYLYDILMLLLKCFQLKLNLNDPIKIPIIINISNDTTQRSPIFQNMDTCSIIIKRIIYCNMFA